ncbi:hypothetical protein Hdeb2414_s0002g00069401 [Helianthus debilis subsp. tardiflorus]
MDNTEKMQSLTTEVENKVAQWVAGLLGGASGTFEVCNAQINGCFVLHLGKFSG